MVSSPAEDLQFIFLYTGMVQEIRSLVGSCLSWFRTRALLSVSGLATMPQMWSFSDQVAPFQASPASSDLSQEMSFLPESFLAARCRWGLTFGDEASEQFKPPNCLKLHHLVVCLYFGPEFQYSRHLAVLCT